MKLPKSLDSIRSSFFMFEILFCIEINFDELEKGRKSASVSETANEFEAVKNIRKLCRQGIESPNFNL